MRRKTFDALLTSAGLVLAIVMVAAGALLLWAHTFVDNQVHDQLAAQQIYFPKAGSDSLNDPAIKPYLTQYAGQQLVNGAQAEAYANHYIAVHIQSIGGGKTYAQLSAESIASPNDAKLAGEVQTVFRGETLRGMLLNAYAFWKMGQIAFVAAIAAFAAAGLLLILSVFGYAHLRRVPADAEVMPKLAGPTPATA
ncbi:hypothetical protein ACFV9C_17400 [Kribbella sp. NPDC059898]|uniref:hypothetical protein n=1 Tax=Kribbella sp. NPDC059898 TaxID=3346995 RepID=UPI003656A88C